MEKLFGLWAIILGGVLAGGLISAVFTIITQGIPSFSI